MRNHRRDRALDARLRRLPRPPPPEGLEQSLLQQIPAAFGAPPRRSLARWALPALAIAALAALALLIGRSDPAWAERLERVAAASRADRIHVVLETRSPPREPFSAVDPGAPFARIEVWAELGADHTQRMRIERSDRIQVSDGTTTTTYDPERRVFAREDGSAADPSLVAPTAWVERVLAADDAELLSFDPDAASVAVHFPGAALTQKAPWFLDDREREVRLGWDPTTGRLASMARSVRTPTGWVEVQRTVSIEYPEALDGSLFALDLPEDARPYEIPPAPRRYDRAGPEEAARLFFEAAIAGDWTTVGAFCPSPAQVDSLRRDPPTALLELGAPFRSGGTWPGVYVPYAVRFRDGSITRHALALRNDNPYGRYVVDGGL